jgi:hypothetical protein
MEYARDDGVEEVSDKALIDLVSRTANGDDSSSMGEDSNRIENLLSLAC